MEYRPFMGSRDFRRFYQPGRPLRKGLRLLGSLWRRLSDVRAANAYDVVFIHREAALFGPPFLERYLARRLHKPVVLDFDDPIFLPFYEIYGHSWRGKLMTLLKCPQKTAETLAMSRSAVVGNRVLEKFAREHNPHVTLIPTVVDTEVVRPAARGRRDNFSAQDPVVLGWVGSPPTYPYLQTLFPVLEEVAKRHPILLRVVGAGGTPQIRGVAVDSRPWRLDGETEDLQSFDIGLYPIVEDQWSPGKSGFKAIQYMAVGIPSVCSPVGAVCDIVEDGVHGFWAAEPAAWQARLCQLIEDAQLRRQLGEAGRARAEEWFCLREQAPRLQSVLQQAAEAV